MSTANGIERFGYRQELRRSIGFADLVFYGLIFMVPIAPFGIFGEAFQTSGGMVPLAYAVALIALVFTAWSYSKMSAAFPMTGGVYNYAGRGIGAPVGFLAGWLILLDYLLVPTLLYVIAAGAMSAVIPLPPALWLVVFLAVNTIVNITGIKITLRAIRFFIVGELAVLLIFLAVGVWGLLDGRGEFSWDPIYNSGTFSLGLILSAASVTVLSFLGFDGIALLAEENRGRARQLGTAMIAALGLAGLLFIAQTWMAAMFTDTDAMLSSTDPDTVGNAFYSAAETAAGGHWLFVVCAAATAIAWGFADTMVAQVASSRLMYAMARDRQLPRFLSKVSVRFGVPVNAIVLAAVISLVLGWIALENTGGSTLHIFGIPVLDGVELDSVGFLSSVINFGAICAFLGLHVSVIWYFFVRKRSGRWFAHLLMPLCGLVVLGSVAYYTADAAQWIAGGWLVLGIVILVGLYAAGRGPKVPTESESPQDRPEPEAAAHRQ